MSVFRFSCKHRCQHLVTVWATAIYFNGRRCSLRLCRRRQEGTYRAKMKIRSHFNLKPLNSAQTPFTGSDTHSWCLSWSTTLWFWTDRNLKNLSMHPTPVYTDLHLSLSGSPLLLPLPPPSSQEPCRGTAEPRLGMLPLCMHSMGC